MPHRKYDYALDLLMAAMQPILPKVAILYELCMFDQKPYHTMHIQIQTWRKFGFYPKTAQRSC